MERREGTSEQFNVERQRAHERMPEQELGNLLAAFGNHEAKALVLASMRPDRIYSQDELYQLIRARQEGIIVWNVKPHLPFNYAYHSLAPIGLVAKEVLDYDLNTYGYIKTDYGREIGDALAGHLLAFSERHPNVSLRALFGSTNTRALPDEFDENHEATRKRAPLIRYRTYWELATRDLPIRQIDLVQAIGEDATLLEEHLRNLSRKGIITYDSRKADKPGVIFEASALQSENPDAYADEPSLTQEVYQALISNPHSQITTQSVYDSLVRDNPNRSKLSEERLKGRISGVLRHLEEGGYINRTRFAKRSLSEISMTDEQYHTINELVSILDQFSELNPEFLQEGRILADQIANNPDRFRLLFTKAKNTSPNASKKPKEELSNYILSTLSRHPNSKTTDIQQHLKDDYGVDIGLSRIIQLAKELRMNQRISVLHRGSAYYYYISDEGSCQNT